MCPTPSILISQLNNFLLSLLPHEINNKAMNVPLFFLIILFLSHLFSHQSFATRKLQDDAVDRTGRASSMNAQEKLLFVKGNDDHRHILRKDLHEVHSGPNPIGNSIPQQKWKTKRGNP